MGGVLVVIGASTGLGLGSAVQAAKAGFIVYATMHNFEKRGTLDAAADAAGVLLNVRTLDLQDTASVEAAVARVISAEGRLD